jgi:hypothetical protein
VFKKYSQMQLQMKREALQKINRAANETAAVWYRLVDDQRFWHSSGTVFARKANVDERLKHDVKSRHSESGRSAAW